MDSFTPGAPRRVWRTVVGVVSDVRYRGLDEVQFDVYDAALQVGRPADNVVVRTGGHPLALSGPVQSLARRLDPSVLVDSVTTMEAVVARAEAPWRLTTYLFALFAALAFGLAVLGLFSLVALDVVHRRREFAIRQALGAQRAAILRAVLVRAAWRVGAGLAAGLAVAVIASRWMRGLLFEVPPVDAMTYGAVAAIVLIAVTAGAVIPARRALSADPHTLLRSG